MVRKGYIYTFVVHIYSFRLTFSCILHCILHHFTLRFAAKRTAFSTKTYCILHQNAGYFAPKRTTFSGKPPQKWCKWRFLQINIHFAAYTNYPLFASKQTFARIDFLRQGGQLVDKKGTLSVKISAKKLTKHPYPSPLGERVEGRICFLPTA